MIPPILESLSEHVLLSQCPYVISGLCSLHSLSRCYWDTSNLGVLWDENNTKIETAVSVLSRSERFSCLNYFQLWNILTGPIPWLWLAGNQIILLISTRRLSTWSFIRTKHWRLHRSYSSQTTLTRETFTSIPLKSSVFVFLRQTDGCWKSVQSREQSRTREKAG